MKLAPYIVGFLDLLGFSAGIMLEEKDPSHLMGRTLKFQAMKSMLGDLIQKSVGHQVEVRWLSDTCLCAVAIEILDATQITQALHDVSTAVGITQCSFGSEDCFSRGGIAIGRMTQAVNDDGSHGPQMDKELFGNGVVRAVELEKKVAKNPRVVVSARLAAAALSLKTTISGRSIFAFDIELPYVDYLSFAEAISPERPDQILAGHAELVHNLVVHSNRVASLRRKAAWLLQYHNSHIESRGGLDHLIVERSISSAEPDEEEPREDSLDKHPLALDPETLRPVQSWPVQQKRKDGEEGKS